VSTYVALATGYLASQAIQSCLPASVIGVTSKGIFVRNLEQRIIFISLEAYKSPLTITLVSPPEDFTNVTPGESVDCSLGEMSIRKADLTISFDAKSVWYPEPPAEPLLPGGKQRLAQIVDLIIKKRPEAGLAPLLSVILKGTETNLSELPDELDKFLPLVQSIRQAWIYRDVGMMVSSMCEIMGRGRGLTPSGDDLVVGFLLALNRWQPISGASIDISIVNAPVVKVAYTKTTTLSANLIETATIGHADERMLALLDGIMTGIPSVEECAANALSLGNSTGIDSLAGIALAII
jgi:hypothetical protein